ncbi:TIGR02281 family clan AA aspartic protease [Aquamicrobium sp. LC103]|uniref:retropepsin-like aspartic protease family protein n=1 Tax=Aquamicrobium sp. LC103 TaxID=1120658 RepID=UPI00063E7370|nr:TIGR02281 family clan AA aspartic protease [Aquamicrobium sp. LC103]TKT79157.1 TIGR02281 family clan AA aspartic protease [Aquamicrobium sp. LC103]
MNRFLWVILAIIGIGLILLVANDESGSVFGFGTDQFGRMLYLGVFGAVIAAGILGSGMRFGHVARSLAVWLLIILALVTGYQYRYELQDIASRMTAGLVPGSPLSTIDGDGRASVMLERMSDGHFQVRAEINGAPVRVMVDTGATSTVLSAQDARSAGFDPDTLAYNVPIMTANGEARAARITIDDFRIGDITRTNMPVLVAEGGRLGQSLLGMNFINTLSGFDMRGERLILRD